MTERNVPSLTRRELLRVGGISLVGGFLQHFTPVNVHGGQRVTPIGSARYVLFVNIDGGMSQIDTLDAREGAWTPADFEIRRFPNGVVLPYGLLSNVAGVLDKITVVRSLGAWDAVHGRAQYYIQTGHPLNLALAKEVPAIGAVVAYELAKERKASDSLPAYIAMNMEGNQAGLVNQGFLSAEFGPMNMRISDEGPPDMIPREGVGEVLARRWERLHQLDGALRSGTSPDRSFANYHEYYRSAWAIMNDPRISQIFTIRDEDRKRYGSSAIGNSLILARNLLQADAGTRFILASHGGWDHHSDIYREKTRNHQVLIRELDRALGNVIRDLDGTPSPHHAGRTLLDDTLVIAMSEFGRVPGPITETRKGREHHIRVHSGIFAGGGVTRGAVMGRTDEEGGDIADAGWSARRAIYMEDVACTIYSALGIDWTKRIQSTPSGRAFHYVEPASGTRFVGFEPVQELFA
ncbi:MAG: DUF1501 domain-containing protein [Acidobacteria bacterium]|nr:DUF1501 domain-containing protein [Acidobacteriota bacterium]